jgi:RNA polymerase sigma factor (sigma-70 family)
MTRAQVAALLGVWQTHELAVARGFSECGGLSDEQLEDLYQETMLALLRRPYKNETHLQRAVRKGLRQRALQLYRDERRREEIRAESTPGLYALETARAADEAPERSALIHEDQLLVSEFLAGLSPLERRVFWLMSEGAKFNSIARLLGIPAPQARKATRACERKRERFVVLYESGRLCGYRATTIQALQAGKATSDELAHGAFAHLQACAHCRAEHKTSACRLKRTFQGQAAALLPIPILAARVGRLARAGIRSRALTQRALAHGPQLGTGAVRERAATLIVGSGAGAKLAAGIVTAAAITASTIAAHALAHPPAHHHRAAHPVSPQAVAAVSLVRSSIPIQVARDARHPRPVRSRPRPRHGRGRFVSTHPATRTSSTHEPGGFAYLGVPTTSASPKTTEAARPAQSGGGPFSP